VRTVFFGTPDIAVPSLAAIAPQHDVTAVVCQPDRPKGRSKKLIPPPVKVWAEEHGIPVYQTEKLNDGTFEAWLREQAPEVCAIAAYGRLLKQPILDIPTKGFINMHPSLLPRWRGPSPISTAILEGDRETGVTIMRLTLDMDAGDILLQETYPIESADTTVTLGARLADRGGDLLLQAMDQIAAGEANYTPQDDAAAVFCRMVKKADGLIDWARPAEAICNQVRAMVPWPVAHSAFGEGVLRIHEAEALDEPVDAEPGTVCLVEKDALQIATGVGQLSLKTVQAPGKRAMAVGDFLRGHHLTAGQPLEAS
jgi:methionyl-tRNA formyltransferase